MLNSGIGVYTGCHEGYYDFAPLFDKIIYEYHGHKPNDKHISDMDYMKLNCPELPYEQARMIVSTRIRVGRNFADYPLGTAITRRQRKQIESSVVPILESFDGELKGKYYSLGGMTEEEKKQLV